MVGVVVGIRRRGLDLILEKTDRFGEYDSRGRE